MSVAISYPASFSRPLRKLSSMRNASATTWPFSCFTSSIVPAAGPPVASRSSTMRTRAPGASASLCISSVADPYSSSYSTETTSAGSLPSFRTGTNPTPSLYAIGAAKMNPRDSMPTTASIFRGPMRSMRPSIAARKAAPSFSRVVMSLKRMPGFGKSGTSRIFDESSTLTRAVYPLPSRRSALRRLAADRHVRVVEELLDAVRGAVALDDRDVRVRRVVPADVRERPHEVGCDDPVRHAVRDEAYRPPQRRRHERVDERGDPRHDLLERFAAGHARPRLEERTHVAVPPLCRLTIEPDELADVPLAQRSGRLDGQAMTPRDRLGRVARAREIARDHASDRLPRERVGDGLRLGSARRRERRVRLAREHAMTIRRALAVTHDDEPGECHRDAAPCGARFSRRDSRGGSICRCTWTCIRRSRARRRRASPRRRTRTPRSACTARRTASSPTRSTRSPRTARPRRAHARPRPNRERGGRGDA